MVESQMKSMIIEVTSKNRESFKELCLKAIIAGIFISASVAAEEVLLPLRVDELVTPWGTPVERMSYYLKNGMKCQHGVEEMYSDDGGLNFRHQYAHGEPDGIQEFFYDGITAKESEMRYVAGVEQGLWRTWSPEGKILFEGTWKDGKEWDGWFSYESSSGGGLLHDHRATWKIAQWQEGRKLSGSEKEVECHWRSRKPNTLADHTMFCRWSWSRFMKRGNSPYLDKMPPFATVPVLIDLFEKKGENYQIARDQLVALTRMDFGNPEFQKDEERIAAAEKWRGWWQVVGRHRLEERKKRGVRDARAWDLVRGGRDVVVPVEPVVIPPAYELKVQFRSGNYLGVTSETLLIRRGKDSAELVREFKTHTDGPVTKERWLPFGIEEADRVIRAIGYLTNQPWLINDEAKIEKEFWQVENERPNKELADDIPGEKLKGRESYGEPYSPGVSFELLDSKGLIWWNADIDRWYGGNPARFNETHRVVPGTVFPFLAEKYPESQRRKNGGGRGWGMK